MKNDGLLLVLVLLIFLMSSSTVLPASSYAPGPAVGPPQPPIDGTPHYVNLVPNLPFLHDASAVLNPIWSHIGQPILNGINKNISAPINSAIGAQHATSTINPNGTVTRTVKNPNWYTRNVGEPISHAVTGAVHTVEGWL